MRILGIETSTEHCSVALWQDGEVALKAERAGQRHSEILLPMIDTLLKEQHCRLQGLDGLAFGAGPGSFTGLRIAASVVQGLALGLGIPVIPVCTLQALAEASGHDKVAASLDARLDEVYFAAFEKQDNHWNAIIPPCLSAISSLPELPGKGWLGVGTGFAVQGGELGRHLHLQHVQSHAFPSAAAIVSLGAGMLRRGAGKDPAEALPIYLRDKVAMTTQERHAKGYR